MGLNIKRPQAEQAIRELAAVDGISLTDAVEVAVKEALERRRGRTAEDEAKRRRKFEVLMRDIERRTPPAPALPEGHRSNHDELYGEDGLPA